jgi:DnaJ-class molecular chaperone
MNKKVWDRCGHCNGTGKIHVRLQPKRRCPACKGMGYIQKSVVAANISEVNSGAEKSGLERRQKPKTHSGTGD